MSLQCVLPLVSASKILNKFCTKDFTFFNFHYTHKLCTGPDCVTTSKTQFIGIRTSLAQTRCPIKNCFLCEYISELWRRQWQPTLVLLPGKSHGRRSLVGKPFSAIKFRLQCVLFLFCYDIMNSNTLLVFL